MLLAKAHLVSTFTSDSCGAGLAAGIALEAKGLRQGGVYKVVGRHASERLDVKPHDVLALVRKALEQGRPLQVQEGWERRGKGAYGLWSAVANSLPVVGITGGCARCVTLRIPWWYQPLEARFGESVSTP